MATWISIPADRGHSAEIKLRFHRSTPTLKMERLMKLLSIFNSADDSAALYSLDTMDLGPTKNTENPVMVSFNSDVALG